MFQFQLLRLLSSCLNRSFRNSQSFLTTFGYLYDTFEIGEKGNTEGRERGCRQSLYRGKKNFWRHRWKTYTRFLTSNTFMPLFALSTMSLPSVQTMTKEDAVGMGVSWIENFRPVSWQRTIRSESTQDKAGSLPPASWDYDMLFAIFVKS